MTITVTITDNTKPVQSLYTLLSSGSQAGYTVAPSPVKATSLTFQARVRYLSIQASVANSNSTYIYTGDENLKADGTCQGKELSPGTIDVDQCDQNAVHLGEIFITASQNGLKANIEVHWA